MTMEEIFRAVMQHEKEITSITVNTIVRNIQQTDKHSEWHNTKNCIQVQMTCCNIYSLFQIILLYSRKFNTC